MARPRPPAPFLEWAEAEALIILVRTPWISHDALRCTCRRLNTLLRSKAFCEERTESGYVEHGVVVVGAPNVRRPDFVQCWLLAANGCRRLRAPPSRPLMFTASCVFDDEIWVIGGGNDVSLFSKLALDSGGWGSAHLNSPSDSVQIHNPRTGSWRIGPSLNAGRLGHIAVAFGDSLVIAGGIAHDGRDDKTVEAYRRNVGWETLPPMPHPAVGAVACVISGRLYVAGTHVKDSPPRTQMFDGATQTWTVLADMPEWRRGAASAVHNGRLVVIGGIVATDAVPLHLFIQVHAHILTRLNSTASVLIYDPRTDKWEASTQLPENRRGALALNRDGAVLLLGGDSSKFDHETLQPLVRNTNGTWSEYPYSWHVPPAVMRMISPIGGSVLLG